MVLKQGCEVSSSISVLFELIYDGTAREAWKLTEKELILCSCVVRGFSLQQKNWSRDQASMMLRLEVTRSASFSVD
jgi:hypothetical protein